MAFSKYYTEQMLADSLDSMADILDRTGLLQESKDFLSHIGAYFISIEPAVAGMHICQLIRCRQVEKGFFEDVLAMRGMGAIAGQIDDKNVSPQKLKGIFPELGKLENYCFKSEMINAPYTHIFASEPAYKPVMAALFKDMPDEVIVLAGKFNKNQVTLSIDHLVRTISSSELRLDIADGINSEIKRINALYEEAEKKRRNARVILPYRILQPLPARLN